MAKNAELLNKTVVYPSTNYPGRTQEGLLGMLLRKKLTPQVETWVAEARSAEGEVHGQTQGEEEFPEWARDSFMERMMTYARDEDGKNYTTEERERGIENVKTGLKRKLASDDDESESEDDDEEMGNTGAAPASVPTVEVKTHPNAKSRTVEDILSFSTSGVPHDPSFASRR